jgi:hypothetical protein
LKKQSQSQNDKIGVILALTMSYGDFSRWRRRKNKAKQSQFDDRHLLVDIRLAVYQVVGPDQLGYAPGLSEAASWLVGRIAVEYLRDTPEAAVLS